VDVFGRPVVVVLGSDAETEALGRQLAEAVNCGWTARGVPPPLLLLNLAPSPAAAQAPARHSGQGRAGQDAERPPEDHVSAGHGRRAGLVSA
jgi:hypothetical protein